MSADKVILTQKCKENKRMLKDFRDAAAMDQDRGGYNDGRPIAEGSQVI